MKCFEYLWRPNRQESVNSKLRLKYFTQTYNSNTYNDNQSIEWCVFICLGRISRILHKSCWQHVPRNWLALIIWTLECTIHRFSFMCKSISLKYLCYGILYKMKNLIHPPKPSTYKYWNIILNCTLYSCLNCINYIELLLC